MRWGPPTYFFATFLTLFLVSLHHLNAGQQQPLADKDARTKEPISFERMRPLLKTYCLECHNTTKKKAGLDLEKFESEKDALAQVELWEQVGEHLRSKAMPPPKKKQPTERERELLLGWVKHVAQSRAGMSNSSSICSRA